MTARRTNLQPRACGGWRSSRRLSPDAHPAARHDHEQSFCGRALSDENADRYPIAFEELTAARKKPADARIVPSGMNTQRNSNGALAEALFIAGRLGAARRPAPGAAQGRIHGFRQPRNSASRICSRTHPLAPTSDLPARSLPRSKMHWRLRSNDFGAARTPVAVPRARAISAASEMTETLSAGPEDLHPQRMRGACPLAHPAFRRQGDSLETMARACRRRGYAWSMVTDHSRGLEVASGLDREGVRLQRGRVETLERSARRRPPPLPGARGRGPGRRYARCAQG